MKRTSSEAGAVLIVGAALAALATLVLALLLRFVYPTDAQLAEGFRTPVLAFELARSTADLAFLAGTDDTAAAHRAAMDAGQRIDMLFPFAYAGLIALTLLGLRRTGVRLVWPGVVFALAAIPADIGENLIMLAITEALAHEHSIAELLPLLRIATWLKWGALALAMVVLSLAFLSRRAWFSGTLSALAGAAILLTWLSDSPQVAEAMMLVVSALFAVLAMRALWALHRWMNRKAI